MMNLQQRETESMPSWFLEFRNHPSAKAFIAEKAAETLETRTKARSELDRLEKSMETALPGLLAKIASAQKKLADIEARKVQCLEELAAATIARRAEVNGFKSAKQDQEALLIESADPEIDRAIEFFQDRLSWLRDPARIQAGVNRLSSKNALNFKQEVYKYSNYNAILAALDYFRAAIAELELMKMQPEFDLPRVEELKAGIPRIDVFVESETYENPLI